MCKVGHQSKFIVLFHELKWFLFTLYCIASQFLSTFFRLFLWLMLLGLFVVALLHAEGVGANGIVRRIPQPVGMLMDNFIWPASKIIR
jgi:hypothetical protein